VASVTGGKGAMEKVHVHSGHNGRKICERKKKGIVDMRVKMSVCMISFFCKERFV